MMRALGILNKMPTSFVHPVQYKLKLGDDNVLLNELLGKEIQIKWTGNIYCILCGRKTKKSFGEGLCYPCFMNAPESAECILHPELCKAHLHQGRDPEWEEKHHNQPHFVYLALTSDVKVGITRDTQIPTRWIDQGAAAAIILAQTPYRQKAGEIEVFLKQFMTDKTQWNKMLTNITAAERNLVEEKQKATNLLPEDLRIFVNDSNEVLWLEYPVINYPAKVSSLSLDKIDDIKLKLNGIRGQYLLFESGKVLNIRKHSGYEVELIA
ncbi:MAG: DUF2797 domain-containing protein [Chitinophagales bacterium]|nr:DUF2797 domain-containing protein [Chitinophagales bacterium]MCO5281212.1 DUF2797 domain-containing protein [Chitinophagales bacterium]HRN93819.1 DUF2797 domain-containing protein [Chitinophagales bacterium]HRP38107.1 DUF2797 domain-containing protein [Chitinophagales bacterium]